MRDIFGNEHVTDKVCLNVLKSIFDVHKEIIFYNPKRFMAFQKSMLHLGIPIPGCFLCEL